ncbi:MAG TPA: hypothetical protein VFR03_15430 [Thermoanaerobaculia bacterium]|nr:hypothetical protein [Thermoanaerobaculia bacterium]
MTVRPFTRFLLFALVAVSLTGPAAAVLVPVGEPFDIGPSNELNGSPAVAARPDGTYVVLATSGGYPPSDRLYLQIVGPGGAAIDDLVIDTNGARSPAIAFRPDGGFVVVYQKAGEILGVVFDHQGLEQTRIVVGPRRQPDLLNQEPAVAVAADGSWMAAWHEPSRFSFGTIYGRWFAPDATPKTPPTVLDEPSTLQHLPQVTAAPDGGFFTFWTEITGGDNVTPPHLYELRGRRFDAQGTPLHGTVHLAYSNQGRLFPRPAGDGFVFLVDGDRTGVVLQRLDLDGLPAGLPVETALPVLQDPGASALDAAGRLLVASMASDERVYARLFDASSLQPLSALFLIPSLQGAKHLASAWPGQFLAFWQETIPITTPIPMGFMGQILTLDCGADESELCLGNGRFRVSVSWRDHQGNTGAGHPVPLGEDTGTFYFFNNSNVEILVKILDGRSLNDHFWVFYGSLSDVEYEIRVLDTVTGQVRTYENPAGHIASHADVQAFPAAAAASAPSSSSGPRIATAPLTPPLPLSCSYSDMALCLLGREYEVTVDFVDPLTGQSHQARALPFSWESGAFWFFDKGNIELYVKVLDGSAVNGRAWVFHGALTDVEYTITVTHVPTRTVWQYHNPRGQMHSGADTSALPPPAGD